MKRAAILLLVYGLFSIAAGAVEPTVVPPLCDLEMLDLPTTGPQQHEAQKILLELLYAAPRGQANTSDLNRMTSELAERLEKLDPEVLAHLAMVTDLAQEVFVRVDLLTSEQAKEPLRARAIQLSRIKESFFYMSEFANDRFLDWLAASRNTSFAYRIIMDALKSIAETSESNNFRQAFFATILSDARQIQIHNTRLQEMDKRRREDPVGNYWDRPGFFETQLPSTYFAKGLNSFALVDLLFRVDYASDTEQPHRLDGERTFGRAGSHVQSDWVWFDQLFGQLPLGPNTHVVDLGSGYGRTGLFVGQMYPSWTFTGYELESNRVAAARAAVEFAGFQDRIQFVEQNLADPEFKIPEADVYYMYDPFSSETYKKVFDRLIAIGRERETYVVLTGSAAGHFPTYINRRRVQGRWRAISSGHRQAIFVSVPGR